MGLLDDAIREHLELKLRRGADAGDISREESAALGPVRRGPDGAPDPSDPSMSGEPAGEAAPPPPREGEQTAVLGAVPTGHDDPAPAAGHRSSPPAPAYEPPAPPPPAEPERSWFERGRDEPEQPGEDFGVDPPPDAEPDLGAEHTSLLARFRVGRKHKGDRDRDHAPAADDDDAPPPSYAPPPLPDSYRPASPYEPPPSTAPPSYAPPVPHESDIVPADDEPDVEDVLEETPDFLEETPEHDRLWFEQRPPRDFDFDG